MRGVPRWVAVLCCGRDRGGGMCVHRSTRDGARELYIAILPNRNSG